jgi:hypothetical protein
MQRWLKFMRAPNVINFASSQYSSLFIADGVQRVGCVKRVPISSFKASLSDWLLLRLLLTSRAIKKPHKKDTKRYKL